MSRHHVTPQSIEAAISKYDEEQILRETNRLRQLIAEVDELCAVETPEELKPRPWQFETVSEYNYSGLKVQIQESYKGIAAKVYDWGHFQGGFTTINEAKHAIEKHIDEVQERQRMRIEKHLEAEPKQIEYSEDEIQSLQSHLDSEPQDDDDDDTDPPTPNGGLVRISQDDVRFHKLCTGAYTVSHDEKGEIGRVWRSRDDVWLWKASVDHEPSKWHISRYTRDAATADLIRAINLHRASLQNDDDDDPSDSPPPAMAGSEGYWKVRKYFDKIKGNFKADAIHYRADEGDIIQRAEIDAWHIYIRRHFPEAKLKSIWFDETYNPLTERRRFWIRVRFQFPEPDCFLDEEYGSWSDEQNKNLPNPTPKRMVRL